VIIANVYCDYTIRADSEEQIKEHLATDGDFVEKHVMIKTLVSGIESHMVGAVQEVDEDISMKGGKCEADEH
jgi:hypothetical protein